MSDLKSAGVSVKYDDDDSKKPGWKFAEYEMKGIPLRIAIGPRDLENKTVELARRDTLSKESISQEGISKTIVTLLDTIQDDLFSRSKLFLKDNIRHADSIQQMNDLLNNKGGFVEAFWDGETETELKIKDLTKATIRCIPLEDAEFGNCILTGKSGAQKVFFARAY